MRTRWFRAASLRAAASCCAAVAARKAVRCESATWTPVVRILSEFCQNFVKISSNFSKISINFCIQVYRNPTNIAFFSIFQNLHNSVKFCKKFRKILQKFCGFLKILQNFAKFAKKCQKFCKIFQFFGRNLQNLLARR